MATTPRFITPEPSPTRQFQFDQVEDLLKLQKAAQRITSILDLDELIDHVVHDVAVSFGCVEASLYLHEPEKSEMLLAGVHGCTCSAKGYRLKVGKEGMVGYVAATGQMRYAPDVNKDPYYVACEPETRSELAIPLLVEGRLVGVFTASHPELDAFPPEQLRLLQSFCSYVAIAVQNASVFQQQRSERETANREIQEARTIQQALLPKASPFIPGFAISGLSVPAGAMGGDWYDFITLEDGKLGIVLADVSGKGTAAALLMSATRGMLRSLAEAHCSPAEVLTKLNRLMTQDFPSGRFVTMVYAVLDPSKRTLTFACAGHLPPLLVSDHSAEFLQTQSGMPLGLGFGEFSESTITLPVDSRFVIYSDGITEASRGDDEEFGARRLQQHLEVSGACPESLLEEVRNFVNGAGLQDDATVVVVRA
jgi:sigma-B regulation protein RsbU (phosphoserine phosphatase)